jgi:cytochrome P450
VTDAVPDASVVYPGPREDPYAPPADFLGGPPVQSCRIVYGGTGWLVTGAAPARAILADGQGYSSDTTRPEFPDVPLASKRTIPGHFINMDAPEHTRLRRVVAAEFSPGRVRVRRPMTRAVIERLVDDLVQAGPGTDLVQRVATPLPGLSVANTFGVAVEDLPFFSSVARRLQRHDATAARRVAASGELNRYLRHAIPAARGGDGDGLLTILAAALDEGYTLDELVGIANLTIVAGLETVAGLLSLTMLSLLIDPRQGDLVRTDPGRWAGAAVTEALRYWTIVQHGVVRVPTRDVVLGGVRVRAGEPLLISLAAANRDATVYPEPDLFDITRDSHQHLAFGHGSHRCLGAASAVAQAELAVAALMTRLPGLRLACRPADLSFLDEMLIYGLRTLPVAW